MRDPVIIGLRQVETKCTRLSGKKFMRQLNKNACAISRLGIGTDRPTVFEIAKNFEPIVDDLAAPLVAD